MVGIVWCGFVVPRAAEGVFAPCVYLFATLASVLMMILIIGKRSFLFMEVVNVTFFIPRGSGVLDLFSRAFDYWLSLAIDSQ